MRGWLRTGGAIYFAVDMHPKTADLGKIDAYFKELDNYFTQNNEPFKVGAYAPGNVLASVGVSYTWLANGWGNDGYTSEKIQQTINSTDTAPILVGGVRVDLDTAYVSDFGQWTTGTTIDLSNAVDPYRSYTDAVPGQPTPTDVANAAKNYATTSTKWGADNCTGLVWAVSDAIGADFYETADQVASAAGESASQVRTIVPDPGTTTATATPPNFPGYVLPHKGETNGLWTTFKSTTNAGDNGWTSDVQIGDLVRIPASVLADGFVHSFIVVGGNKKDGWQVIDNTSPSGAANPVIITEHTFDYKATGNEFYKEILGANQAFISRLTTSMVAPTATLNASNNAAQNFQFDSTANAAIAQTLLAPLNASIASGALITAPADAAPAVPSGKTGLLLVTRGGQYTIGDGYAGLVNTATVPTTVFGGASNGQLVVAGNSGMAFNAGKGAGTIIAGGGNNLISVYPDAGVQYIITGDGDNTVVVLSGANTVNGGTGNNQILAQGGDDVINSFGTDLINVASGNSTVNAGANNPTIFLGTGAAQFNGGSGSATVVVGAAAATLNGAGGSQLWMQAGGGLVNSTGADTIIGGSGAATVNASSGNDFVFAGNGLLKFLTGSGVSTILGAANGTASMFGGSGSLIDIGYGATNFTGGSGADTIAAFGGSATITGGSGTDVFLGAPGGQNQITGGSGRATIFGGGEGDVLTAGSGPGDVIQAGGGAETISALGSSGSETFYGGPGSDLFLMGSGTTQLLTGTGSDTIAAGGGTELIAFSVGNHATALIENFTVGTDFISFVGFAAGTAATALAAATVTNGSEKLVLSDGTQITFQNVTGLSSSSFL